MAASSLFNFPVIAINRPLSFMGVTYQPGDIVDISSADPRRLQLLVQQNRIAEKADQNPDTTVSATAPTTVTTKADQDSGQGQGQGQGQGLSGYKPSRTAPTRSKS